MVKTSSISFAQEGLFDVCLSYFGPVPVNSDKHRTAVLMVCNETNYSHIFLLGKDSKTSVVSRTPYVQLVVLNAHSTKPVRCIRTYCLTLGAKALFMGFL